MDLTTVQFYCPIELFDLLMTSDYHHGDLPKALRAAAVEVIAERGPASFSLREVARRVGVSHTAPAHHFGDAQGLLNSVAAEGFTLLTNAMRDASKGISEPDVRLLACGRAYIKTALENPGHYALMVKHDYTDESDPYLAECGIAAYAVLLETVELLRDKLNPALDVERTATILWASVHGLVELSTTLEFVAETSETALSTIDQLLETLTSITLNGVQAH